MKPSKYAGKELHYIQRMMEGFDFDDWVRTFEQKFSEKIGGKHCIAVNSGTSALHAALVACEVKGGEVLLPALVLQWWPLRSFMPGPRQSFVMWMPIPINFNLRRCLNKLTENTKAILGFLAWISDGLE